MSAHSVALAAGFEGLLNLVGEPGVPGEPVTIGGTEKRGQVSNVEFDEVLAPDGGGILEVKSFTVKLRNSDFPSNVAKFTDVTVTVGGVEVTRQVATNNRWPGHLEIQCARPEAIS